MRKRALLTCFLQGSPIVPTQRERGTGSSLCTLLSNDRPWLSRLVVYGLRDGRVEWTSERAVYTKMCGQGISLPDWEKLFFVFFFLFPRIRAIEHVNGAVLPFLLRLIQPRLHWHSNLPKIEKEKVLGDVRWKWLRRNPNMQLRCGWIRHTE